MSKITSSCCYGVIIITSPPMWPSKKMPVFFSTGAAYLGEIEQGCFPMYCKVCNDEENNYKKTRRDWC